MIIGMELITADELYDGLCRDEKILLLDCRVNEEYRAGHISGSYNIVLPQLMLRRLKANKLPLKSLVPPNRLQEKETFLNKCHSYQIVLYDHFVSDINGNDISMLNLLYKRLKDEQCSVVVLQGGYKAFEESHSEFCNVSASTLSSDNDTEDFGTDKSTKFESGGRFSPVSDLAPTILGLNALQISKEIDDADLQNPKNDNYRKCYSTCLCHNQLNSDCGSDEAPNTESRKRLTRVKKKPAPISLQPCCTCKVDTPDVPYPSPCNYVNVAGPAEILPCLFLGCAKDASSEEILTSCKISYILNVTPNLPNVFEGNPNYKYKQIPITDHWSQNLSQFFPDAISFIDEARDNNCGILVHCLAGISRSVTLTVAYLMQKLKWSLNDAYDFVKQRKSNVSPNFNFMGQLLDFEKTLGVGNSASPDDSSSLSSVSSGASTPLTLFFTSPPPPTPTLTLPIRNDKVTNISQRKAFIIPTTAT